MKIAVVVQRYGADINGGAELHARYIAEGLSRHADVRVLTTCARDYVTWRKNDGTNNALANDNGLGTPIGPAHYSLWRANFGNPPGSGNGGGLVGPSQVPEPATLVLLCTVTLLITGRKRAFFER